MQEHALAEIVVGKENLDKAVPNSQAQSVIMGTAFRANRDDVAISEERDDSFIELPKSPAQIEMENSQR